VQVKGNGQFASQTGRIIKKGRLAWVTTEIFGIGFIASAPGGVLEVLRDGVHEHRSDRLLFAGVGDVDFPIVKKVRFGIYPN
jgi:hypothetical protein